MKALDLAGVRFGRLTTIRANGKSSKGEILWLCVCDCGKEISRRGKRGQPTLVETSLMRHMHRRGARFADLAHAFGYDARTTKRYATGANQ